MYESEQGIFNNASPPFRHTDHDNNYRLNNFYVVINIADTCSVVDHNISHMPLPCGTNNLRSCQQTDQGQQTDRVNRSGVGGSEGVWGCKSTVCSKNMYFRPPKQFQVSCLLQRLASGISDHGTHVFCNTE